MNSLQYAEPSEMVCPNCGSTHIFINRMQTGTVNTFNGSSTAYGAGHIAFGSGKAHTYSKITSQRMAKCQDRGFNYPYITEEDIFTARNAAEKEMDKGMAMIVISIVTGIIAAVLVHMQEKERRLKLK